MPHPPADQAHWELQASERQKRTRFVEETEYDDRGNEDGRSGELHADEAPRRDDRQHEGDHHDGYCSRGKPENARAYRQSDDSRRTERDPDGKAPAFPYGKGKHARNLRNDAKTEELKREADDREEFKPPRTVPNGRPCAARMIITPTTAEVRKNPLGCAMTHHSRPGIKVMRCETHFLSLTHHRLRSLSWKFPPPLPNRSAL